MAALDAVVEVEHVAPAPGAERLGSVLDRDFEQGIRKWQELGEEAQREQLAPVVKSFGVGGP